MNCKLTFGLLIIFFLSFSACNTFEVSSISIKPINWERVKVTNVSFKKGNEDRIPINSIAKIFIPSENIIYKTANLDSINIPDKELGSKEIIEITICATFQNDGYWGGETVEKCSEKQIIYSSPKFITCNNTPIIDNLNNPTLTFKPILKRTNFVNKEELEIINAALEVDKAQLLFSTSSNKEVIIFSIDVGRNDLKTQRQVFSRLKTSVNKELTINNRSTINSELQVSWKNKTQKWEKVSSEIYPKFIALGRDRPMNNELDKYESHYYKLWIPDNRLFDWELGEIGVATFKNFDSSSNLKIEIFKDKDLTNKVSENTTSNTLYSHYNKENIYIKVSNKNNYSSNYGLAFHSVDHTSIIVGEALVNLIEAILYAKFHAYFGENTTAIMKKTYLSGGDLEVALSNEVQRGILNALNLGSIPPFVIRSIKKIYKEIRKHEDSYYQTDGLYACDTSIEGTKVNIRNTPVNGKVLLQGTEGDCIKILATKYINTPKQRILKNNTYFTMKGDTERRFVINKGRAVDFVRTHNSQLAEIKITDAEGKKITGYTATDNLEEMKDAWYKVKFTKNRKVGWVYGKFVSQVSGLVSR